MTFIITIDGGGATGKTEIAKQVASKLAFSFLSTGKLYRIIALYALKNDLVSEEKRKQLLLQLKKIEIKFKDNKFVFFADEKELESEEVSLVASKLSQIQKVRDFSNSLQRKFAYKQNIVIEGRDSGSEVFRKADLKFFLIVDLEIAAERRYQQLRALNPNISKDDVKKNLTLRNHYDYSRELAPLRQTNDSIVIDTSNYTISQITKMIYDLVLEKIKNGKK